MNLLNKFLGHSLLLFSIIIVFVALSQFNKLVAILAGIAGVLKGRLTSYEVGYLVGELLIWGMIFIIAYFSWKKGKQLIG